MLRASGGRFHMVADNISQLPWTCDLLGNVTWYNSTAAQTFYAATLVKAKAVATAPGGICISYKLQIWATG